MTLDSLSQEWAVDFGESPPRSDDRGRSGHQVSSSRLQGCGMRFPPKVGLPLIGRSTVPSNMRFDGPDLSL